MKKTVIKSLTTIGLIIVSSNALAQEPELICKGKSIRGESTYSVRILNNEEPSIEIEEIWGGGEELDSDSVGVIKKINGQKTVYTQVSSSGRLVSGLTLSLQGSRALLHMAQSPSGNLNERSLLTCKVLE